MRRVTRWVEEHPWRVVSASLLLSGVLLWWALHPETKWDPLGEFDVQFVLNTVEGFDGPVVDLSKDTTIDVFGTKCNNSTQPVTVRGTFGWRRDDPPGKVIPVITTEANIQFERPPGCEQTFFPNPIPEGMTPGVWHGTGSETPIRDGEEGVPAEIRTVLFRVVDGG